MISKFVQEQLGEPLGAAGHLEHSPEHGTEAHQDRYCAQGAAHAFGDRGHHAFDRHAGAEADQHAAGKQCDKSLELGPNYQEQQERDAQHRGHDETSFVDDEISWRQTRGIIPKLVLRILPRVVPEDEDRTFRRAAG
jgi:hypothetical protein